MERGDDGVFAFNLVSGRGEKGSGGLLAENEAC
jgi:hypothetical protein